ncbi:MAG: FAD/NAD(P)-binding protein [Desulfobacterales bacterium]
MSESIRQKIAYYIPEPAVVNKATELTESEKSLSIRKKSGIFHFNPGQFVQISVFGYGEAPFSVCSSPINSEDFEICVRAVGNVSRSLHHLVPGSEIGIRGPYGKGFPIDQMKNKNLMCIAGGIGIAPLRSLITLARENRNDFKRLIVVYGAKTPSNRLFQEDLDRWESDSGMETHQIVDKPDDSWKGPTGVVTDPLKQIDIEPEETVAAVVGPPAVFRFVAMELLNMKLREDNIFFSLERRFQCGVGKCGHCQLNDLYVCQNGPVFAYSDLIGRTEALEAWAPEDE